MARHMKTVIVTDDGRDKGKRYIITEKSASDAEWWADRVILAIGRTGVDIGEIEGLGMQGLAILGFKALFKIGPMDLKPLLDEMFDCVTFEPSPGVVRGLIEDDIEEVATRLMLRAEIFTLHTGFSIPGMPSTSESKAAARGGSSNTKTSPLQSARPSRRGGRPL